MTEILVCNDQEDLFPLAALLCSEQHSVEEVYSATEAIQRILSKHFQVAIFSIPLRGIDTFEAISIVRQIAPHLPIIVLTGEDSIEIQRKVRQEKIFYYLLKPIDWEELREVVRAAVAREFKQ